MYLKCLMPHVSLLSAHYIVNFIIIVVDLQNCLRDSKYFVSHSVAYFVLPYWCLNELEGAKFINLSFVMILLVSCL